MKKYILYILLLFVIATELSSQESPTFTRQDTLRGSITAERAWWDLLHYDLHFNVYTETQTISGTNTIRYKVLASSQVMQIDLQPPMKITSVSQLDVPLTYTRDGNVYYIDLAATQNVEAINEVTISFEGASRINREPPWNDGMTWKKDDNGNDFVATSCQGIGASIWWPNKDHMYDEPDEGLQMKITTPKHLVGVGNGRLIQTTEQKETMTYTWQVVNPINSYGVNINVGDYVHFSEVYKGEEGDLDCDYYVLSYNLEKAKKQFKDVPKTLEAFEHWFGPYPFYEDSYKLVEVPYLGMEHQSSITYGNGYKPGYMGKDLSETNIGLKFDYIIIHESGHEWFANNVTYKDIADMWVHEGFTTYAENLFIDYHFGSEDADGYVMGLRRLIRNDQPIIGPYNVNKSGSMDRYMKGANILHTLRKIIDNDEQWRSILRGLNKDFYHQTVHTSQIEEYIDDRVEMDLVPFFEQYLRRANLPTLEYTIDGSQLKYRFVDVVDDFYMPVRVVVNDKIKTITPNTEWQSSNVGEEINSFRTDPNYYYLSKEVE